MEENTQKKKQSKYDYKKIALVLVGALIVVLIFIKLVMWIVSLIFGHGISSDVKLVHADAKSDYAYSVYDDGILYANSQSAKMYSNEGNYESEVMFGAHNPFVDTCGDYAVLCDINSSKLALLENKNNIGQIEIKQPVMFAKVNSKGDVAAVTSEKGYKSAVYIYDKKGNEKYIWHSGSGYVADIELSENGKSFVVLAINTDNEKINTVVTWFDISKEKPYGQVIIPDCFAYRLVYDGDDALVVANNGIYKTDYKEVTATADFQGRILLCFDEDENGDIVTAQKITNSESCIVKYNKRLKESFNKQIPFEATALSCGGEKIAVSGTDNILVLKSGGGVYALGNIVGSIDNILMSEDGKRIFSFSEDKIKIHSIKLGR